MTPTLQGINLQILALASIALVPAAPYMAALLTQSKFPRPVNALIAFLVCVFAGLVAFWRAGGSFIDIYNGHNLSALAAAVGVIFTGSKAFYHTWGYKDPIIEWLKSLGVTASAAAAAAPSYALDATQPISAATLAQVVALPAPVAVIIPVVPAVVPAPAVETPPEAEVAEVPAEATEPAVEAVPVVAEPVAEPTQATDPAPEPEGTEGD